MAPAVVSVQAPHRFRIRASHPISGAELADFGSNDEGIWFWGQGGPGDGDCSSTKTFPECTQPDADSNRAGVADGSARGRAD